MTRISRIAIPGWVHHLTQRGNHRQRIFFQDEDRLVYLRLLTECLATHEIILVGYSLMDNHVHLAAIPGRQESFAVGIGRMHRDFARWQNIQRNQTGHLLQNRYYSCPVEEDRVWRVLAYIELNPVRAKLVADPCSWEWSSARAHVTGQDPTGLLEMSYLQRRFTSMEWRDYLEKTAADMTAAAQIRYATRTGRLLGSDATAKILEAELGRPLLPKRRGRKPLGGCPLLPYSRER